MDAVHEPASPAQTEQFQNTIAEVLKLNRSFGMIWRAKDLAKEYGKIFVQSRILTDFRASFPENFNEDLTAGIITHQLRILYHHDESNHSEIFITMDSQDLQELKEDILRAERKEKALQSKLQAGGITLLSLDGLHSGN